MNFALLFPLVLALDIYKSLFLLEFIYIYIYIYIFVVSAIIIR